MKDMHMLSISTVYPTCENSRISRPAYLARVKIARLNNFFFTPDEMLAYAECIPFTSDEVHILSIYSPLPSCKPVQHML